MSGTKFIGDIVSPAGKYIKDGEEKTRWQKCGGLFQNERGQFRIKLEAIPVNMHETNGWFSVFEKDNKQQPQQQSGFRQPAPVQQQFDPDDDDIPFK